MPPLRSTRSACASWRFHSHDRRDREVLSRSEQDRPAWAAAFARPPVGTKFSYCGGMFGPEIPVLLSVLLTALTLGPAMAHLLEAPVKLFLPRDQYFQVQQIYRGWAFAGIFVVWRAAVDRMARDERPGPGVLAHACRVRVPGRRSAGVLGRDVSSEPGHKELDASTSALEATAGALGGVARGRRAAHAQRSRVSAARRAAGPGAIALFRQSRQRLSRALVRGVEP